MGDQDPPQLGEMLQTAQRMQQQIQRIQEELAKSSVEGSAGGGMVVAQVNGRQQLLSLRIDPAVADPADLTMLQDLVVAAVNQALGRAMELAQKELAQVAGGLPIKIPGLT